MEIQSVMDGIAAIIRDVGKREDIEEQIAEKIDLPTLASELLIVEGPVRDAAIKAIINFFYNLEIEEGSRLEERIFEQIDVQGLIKNPSVHTSFQAALINVVNNVIEDAGSEYDNFRETIYDAFGLDDSKRLLRIISEDSQKEIALLLVSKIIEYFQDIPVSEMEEETFDEIIRFVLSENCVEECLKENQETVRALVLKTVMSILESSDEYSEGFIQQVFESPTLKRAIDSSVEKLIMSGKIDSLVEKTAEAIMIDGGSDIRNQIQTMISKKLVDRVAESLVSKIIPS